MRTASEAMGLERELPRIDPGNVKGIEINPYAAELARVSVWIGQTQWMLRNGFGTSKPILRPIQKSHVVSSGIETTGIERIGSTRRGVLTTPWHAEDGPMMCGECCGGVPIRVFPPDGGPRASGCHGAAKRRTASLEDGPFRAVRRSGWRRGRPVGGRRSGDWPGGCTGTRRARAQWRWRRCSTPPDCAAGFAPRRGSDPRRS